MTTFLKMKSFLQKSVTIVVQENRQSSVINLLLFLQILLIFISESVPYDFVVLIISFSSIKQYNYYQTRLISILPRVVYHEMLKV